MKKTKIERNLRKKCSVYNKRSIKKTNLLKNGMKEQSKHES